MTRLFSITTPGAPPRPTHSRRGSPIRHHVPPQTPANARSLHRIARYPRRRREHNTPPARTLRKPAGSQASQRRRACRGSNEIPSRSDPGSLQECMSPRSAGYWLSWRRIIVLSRALSQPCFFSRPSSDPPTLDELRLLDTRSWGLGSIGASPRKTHATVAIIPHHPRRRTSAAIWVSCCNNPRIEKMLIPIVLRDIRIAHRHQWQIHGSRIRHIAGRVEPVLEKKNTQKAVPASCR